MDKKMEKKEDSERNQNCEATQNKMKCPNEIQERERERERGAQNKISAKKRNNRKMGRREETKIKEFVVKKKRFNEN